MPPDAWRAYDGQTNYIRKDGVEFCGKVLQVQPDGVRVSGDYGTIFTTHYFSRIEDSDRNQEFFVAHFPYSAAEDELISPENHYMAYYVGTYTYTTVQGASRTIRKLDYGIPCDVPQWFLDKQKELEQAELLAEIVKKQKLFIAQSNAVIWLQSQATNGDTSAQCSLGEHYLKGEGCETNREQAIYWLKKAADQGDIEASNKLVNLK